MLNLEILTKIMNNEINYLKQQYSQKTLLRIEVTQLEYLTRNRPALGKCKRHEK